MGELSGPALRERRERLGLDRRAVASRAGITVAQLCAVESGGKREKVVERMPKVDGVLTDFETNGVPEGTNSRRGRRASGGGEAEAESGEEGDSASDSDSESEPDTPLQPEPPGDGVVGRWKEWGEFKYDDPVTASAYPGVIFSFVAYVQPMRGKPYVDVWGGRRGHEQLKAVNPASVAKSSRAPRNTKYEDSVTVRPAANGSRRKPS